MIIYDIFSVGLTVDVLFLQLHWLANLRHEQVEQTVEVPVPMTQEEVVHVPTVTW